MSKKASSLDEIMSALPAVQAAIREEIAARIAAGEEIVSEDSDGIRQVLANRRKQLETALTDGKAPARKTAA